MHPRQNTDEPQCCDPAEASFPPSGSLSLVPPPSLRPSRTFLCRLPFTQAGPRLVEARNTQMTRSPGKSAYQGKPHTGSSETSDASCRFAVPTSSRLRLSFPGKGLSRKPGHFPVRGFPGKLGPLNRNEATYINMGIHVQFHQLYFQRKH